MAYVLLRRRWLLKAYILSLVVCLGLAAWLASGERYLQFAPNYRQTVFHEDFRAHLVATYQGTDLSTAERYYRWVAGVRMSSDHLATGSGPNTFYPQYKSYALPAFKTWVSHNEERSTVHNYYLLLLIEQGVPGLLLFLLLLGLAFWTAEKRYYRGDDAPVAALAAVILVMVCTLNFLSDLIETDKVGPVFYLCLTALAGGKTAPPSLRYGGRSRAHHLN